MKISRFENKLFMTIIIFSWKFPKTYWKTVLNDTGRQKMKNSLKKGIYYLKNLLSISKIAKLGKRKKQALLVKKKLWKAWTTSVVLHSLSWFKRRPRRVFSIFLYDTMTPNQFQFLVYLHEFTCSPFLLEECWLFFFVTCFEDIFDVKVFKISSYLTHFLNHVLVSFELWNPISKFFDMRLLFFFCFYFE